MTVYEALSILEISGSYDEKGLKIVYRKLAKKYHPDNFKDDKERKKAEEKLKQINIAYETLLNSEDRSDYQENIDLVLNYKLEKIEGLKKYQIKKYGQLFPNIVFYINEIIRIFGTKMYNTVREVDCSYNNSLTEILKVYLKFQNEFYQRYNIDEKEVTNRVNYNCSFDEFYEQLLSIKEKYSIENEILRKIEVLTEKYKYYAGYDIAKAEIDTTMKNAYNKILEWHHQNLEDFSTIVKDYFNDINEEIAMLISQAFYLQNKINDLKDKVEKTDDDEIVQEYINLKTNFDEGQLFSKTNDEINMIEEMIIIKDHIGELRRAVHQDYIKQFISEKDAHKKIIITSTYNEVFDYIKSLKKLSRIGGIASMLEDKDYVRVIILIELYIMRDDLEKMKQNNDSDYKKHM